MLAVVDINIIQQHSLFEMHGHYLLVTIWEKWFVNIIVKLQIVKFNLCYPTRVE